MSHIVKLILIVFKCGTHTIFVSALMKDVNGLKEIYEITKTKRISYCERKKMCNIPYDRIFYINYQLVDVKKFFF